MLALPQHQSWSFVSWPHSVRARVALPFRAADGLPLLSRAFNVRLPASGFQPLPLCGFNFLRDVESRCKLRGGYHCGNKSNVAWSNLQDVRDRAVSLQPSDRDVDAGRGSASESPGGLSKTAEGSSRCAERSGDSEGQRRTCSRHRTALLRGSLSADRRVGTAVRETGRPAG